MSRKKNFHFMFSNYELFQGTASNAVNAHSGSEQALKKLEKDSKILYDLAELERIFCVTKRTLFNWQAKNLLPLINFGGKWYLSHGKLMDMILTKEGALQ